MFTFPATFFTDFTEFLPSDLANLNLWLDADDASTLSPTTGNVSTWADKSPSGNNATQTISTGKPLIVSAGQNGKTVLRFDGTTDHLNLNINLLPLGTSARSVFIVSKTSNTSEAKYVFHYGTLAASGQRFSTISTPSVLKVALGNGNAGNSTLPNNTTMKVDSLICPPSILNTGILLKRNNISYTNTLHAGGNFLLNTGTSFEPSAQIGAYTDFDFFFEGDIAEIIIYSRELDDEETGQVNDYLINKWGVVDIRFKPDDLSSLNLWLDADDASTLTPSTGNIATWTDKSLSSNNATQTISTAKPLIVANAENGKTVLRFDGTTDFMDLNPALLPLGTIARTFFIAYKGLSTQGVLDYGSNATGTRITLSTGPDKETVAFGVSNIGRTDLIANPAFRQMAFFFDNNEITGNVQITRNGVDISPILLGGSGTLSINTASSYAFLGRGDPGVNFLNGDIGEIIFYDRLLTLSERTQVYDYLKNKWNI